MAKTKDQPDLVHRFKELWINELMPTFKKDLLTELKTEIGKQMKIVTERFESKIRDLDKKLNSLETSQSFVSSKFDAFTAGLANTKKDIKTINDKVNQLEDSISHFENDLYDNMASLDVTQQYLRRDCLEITGIPVIPLDNPTRLVGELSSALDIDLNEREISTAHRLPATKKVKERIIVKFVRRDKRNEIYKQRSKLHGKDTSCLPSVAAELGKSIADKPTKIYINESLTPYRRRLFGKLNTFKNTNKWKYLWTTNGTIHLRQTDSSQKFHFDTMEDFEEFVNPQKDKK